MNVKNIMNVIILNVKVKQEGNKIKRPFKDMKIYHVVKLRLKGIWFYKMGVLRSSSSN